MGIVLFTTVLFYLWNLNEVHAESCSTANSSRLNRANYFITSGAGRIEICYCNIEKAACQWSTIPVPESSTSWGWKNALVACRELYPQDDYGAANPILQDTLPPSAQAQAPQWTYPFALLCDGTEGKLSECHVTSTDIVSHARDAHIQCRTNTPFFGDVRLTGFAGDSACGMVEIYRGSSKGWSTVCKDSWDNRDANVVCIQLGYVSGIASGFYTSDFSGTNYGSLGVYEVSCSGSEVLLDHCIFETDGNCSQSKLRAGAVCIPSFEKEGSVRLNPSYADESYDQRVEVLYNGRWGTVCDKGWDKSDGETICQNLGLGSPDDIKTNPSFRSVSHVQSIWISNLACKGSESDLSSCAAPLPVGYAPLCSHQDDVALTCKEKPQPFAVATFLLLSFCIVFWIFLIIALLVCTRKQRDDDHDQRQWELILARMSNIRNAITTCIAGLILSLLSERSDSETTPGPPPPYCTVLEFHENGDVHPQADSDLSEDTSLPLYTLTPAHESNRTAEETELLPSDTYLSVHQAIERRRIM